MATRWSEPSGNLGTRRFRVWPDGSDQYNHVEHAQNWDMIDAIIGLPADGSEWPPTEGEDGGLYAAIQDLQFTILPIGMMVAWMRPNQSVPFPSGWVECVGQVVLEADHDFGIAGSVTIPDMRNRFAMGANAATAIGTAGVAVAHANIEAAAGAPGPQGVGGSNVHTLTSAQMAAHSHPGSKTGWSSMGLLHWNIAEWPIQDVGEYSYQSGGNSTGTGVGGWQVGQHRHLINDLTPAGSGAAHDNRPRYAGVIWIMKVRNQVD